MSRPVNLFELLDDDATDTSVTAKTQAKARGPQQTVKPTQPSKGKWIHSWIYCSFLTILLATTTQGDYKDFEYDHELSAYYLIIIIMIIIFHLIYRFKIINLILKL